VKDYQMLDDQFLLQDENDFLKLFSSFKIFPLPHLFFGNFLSIIVRSIFFLFGQIKTTANCLGHQLKKCAIYTETEIKKKLVQSEDGLFVLKKRSPEQR